MLLSGTNRKHWRMEWLNNTWHFHVQQFSNNLGRNLYNIILCSCRNQLYVDPRYVTLSDTQSQSYQRRYNGLLGDKIKSATVITAIVNVWFIIFLLWLSFHIYTHVYCFYRTNCQSYMATCLTVIIEEDPNVHLGRTTDPWS